MGKGREAGREGGGGAGAGLPGCGGGGGGGSWLARVWRGGGGGGSWLARVWSNMCCILARNRELLVTNHEMHEWQ